MDSNELKDLRETVRHGGDTAAAEARFGRPAAGWLDLSTGISPFAYPLHGIADDDWRHLPGARAEAALKAAAADAYGVLAGSDCVVAAPGSQAILQWLPRLRPRSAVAVVGPTYAEHAHVWRAAGHAVTEVEELSDGADVVVAVNPNNPDGRRHAPDALLDVARRLGARGGWLVVDEAFADVTPEISVALHAGRSGLIVVRSFGKFYGLAGLRLGFALAASDVAGSLAAAIGPWAVAGPAIAVGTRALADDAWRRRQRARLSEAAEDLGRALAEAGLAVVGGTDLFVLAESDRAPAVAERLGRAGILVRTFDADPRRLRFGLPGTEPDWRRLRAALVGA